MEKVLRFLKDEEGVTALEYGLIAGLIAVAIIAGAQLLGTGINDLFTNVASKVTGAIK